jgi:hypothetical protein
LLSRVVAQDLSDTQLVNGVDSRVILGAFAKGRSSSSQLNKVLRGCLGLQVLGRKRVLNFWVPSADNPADDPSRSVTLRRPARSPAGLARLVLPERTPSKFSCHGVGGDHIFCRELFAGCAGLTSALRRLHLACDVPMEAFPQRRVYVKEHDLRRRPVVQLLEEAIKGGSYKYLHFALPCSSWSCIQLMNGGSRRLGFSEGDSLNPKEVEANSLADAVARLCWLQHRAGGYFTIENPDSSYVWSYQPIASLLRCCVDVVFDQCTYMLRPPHHASLDADTRIRKRTRIRTNLVLLQKLGQQCTGGHTHFHCLGSVNVGGKSMSVAQAAGQYPPLLCSKWASLVKVGLTQEQERVPFVGAPPGL